MGHGYLELKQVNYRLTLDHVKKKPSFYVPPDEWLVPSLLQTRKMYVLDTETEVFIWEGRQVEPMIRRAAIKLADDLRIMINRPQFTKCSVQKEGVESFTFRSQFKGWDSFIRVNYQLAPDKAVKFEQAVKEAASEVPKPKADLKNLFNPRRNPIPDDQAYQLVQDFNDDLDTMDAFVLEGKKFVPLPRQEQGVFYSHDCYVYVCKYFPPEDECNDDSDDSDADDTQCVVYWGYVK